LSFSTRKTLNAIDDQSDEVVHNPLGRDFKTVTQDHMNVADGVHARAESQVTLPTWFKLQYLPVQPCPPPPGH